MSIKKPSAVESPYVTTNTTPTRLASKPVAGGGVNTVAADVAPTVSANANANANADTTSASTGSNVSYYTSGIEGVAGLANYGRVFDGANVYVTLEQPQYITYNQNYTGSGTVGGANGQVQFNNNGNFAGSANLTFNGSTLSAGAINTGNLSAVGITAGNVITPTVYNNGMAMQGYDYVQMQYSNAVALPVSTYDLGTGSWFYLDAGGAVFESNTTGNIKSMRVDNNGNISATGNITGNYFIGNGSQLTGISGGSSNKIFNGNSYANIANASGNVVVGANGNIWTFGTDGTTEFPNNVINPGNNQPLTIRTQSSGNAYTIMYQSSNSWEAYAEDDNTEANSAYAWIKADLNTANTPRVFINNVRGGDGLDSTWTFDDAGNLTLPNGALLKDTDGESVAFGLNAGANSQQRHSVAIGSGAGQTAQGEDSVAIGWDAGSNNQVRMGIAIGWNAGNDNQGQNSQAYGQSAGAYYQQSGAVAMGLGAGRYLQGQEAVAIGQYAGYGGLQSATVASMPSPDVVRIVGSTSSLYNGMTVVGGSIAPGNGLTIVNLSGEDITLSSVPAEPLTNGDNLNFYPAQATGAVAIGSGAGQTLQAQNAVAVGYLAGQTRQGYAAVSIGEDAGYQYQGLNAIAIGRTAGYNTQGNASVAMGWNAGQETQGNSAVAIGEDAGRFNQGQYSIAIGRTAGYNLQANNSIILNATGVHVNTITANSFTVAPVRASTLNDYSQDTGNVLYYNTFTHEVTTAPLNNITGDPFAANIYDSTANVTVWTASSDQVVGAKLTVRVVYASSGWNNTEMLDIAIAKNYPDGTPAFTVSNRVKTNPAYSDTLIDVTLTGGNVLQVISSALDGAGNNVYWTCSATSFNQTFD